MKILGEEQENHHYRWLCSYFYQHGVYEARITCIEIVLPLSSIENVSMLTYRDHLNRTKMRFLERCEVSIKNEGFTNTIFGIYLQHGKTKFVIYQLEDTLNPNITHLFIVGPAIHGLHDPTNSNLDPRHTHKENII